MTKILKDFRVVELGTYITGPAAGMHLADLGADVIKVERPGTGDPFRAFKGGLYSPHYQTYNRNKRSIALDTRQADDLKVFHDLVATADVFIQNFRPGVAEKLGAGEEALRKVNPAIIYCAITGFGASGPYRDKPVYDTVAQAASGYLRLLTPPDRPRVIGPAIADAVTGQYAALGICAALLERSKTGKGRRLDISMLEAMAHFNLDSFTHYYSVGQVMGPLSRPEVSQSYTFECADGKWIAFHLSSPTKFWDGLVAALDHPEIGSDSRFRERMGRIDNHEELVTELTPIFRERSRGEWCERLATRRSKTRRPATSASRFRPSTRKWDASRPSGLPIASTAHRIRTSCRRRHSTNTGRRSGRSWPGAPLPERMVHQAPTPEGRHAGAARTQS